MTSSSSSSFLPNDSTPTPALLILPYGYNGRQRGGFHFALGNNDVIYMISADSAGSASLSKLRLFSFAPVLITSDDRPPNRAPEDLIPVGGQRFIIATSIKPYLTSDPHHKDEPAFPRIDVLIRRSDTPLHSVVVADPIFYKRKIFSTLPDRLLSGFPRDKSISITFTCDSHEKSDHLRPKPVPPEGLVTPQLFEDKFLLPDPLVLSLRSTIKVLFMTSFKPFKISPEEEEIIHNLSSQLKISTNRRISTNNSQTQPIPLVPPTSVPSGPPTNTLDINSADAPAPSDLMCDDDASASPPHDGTRGRRRKRSSKDSPVSKNRKSISGSRSVSRSPSGSRSLDSHPADDTDDTDRGPDDGNPLRK